ncbi:MAG: hypothetical protein JWN34_1560 [Bryobacterales bacterium]|nr:hypothetical protein [Bryobacterales bacterium]
MMSLRQNDTQCASDRQKPGMKMTVPGLGTHAGTILASWWCIEVKCAEAMRASTSASPWL